MLLVVVECGGVLGWVDDVGKYDGGKYVFGVSVVVYVGDEFFDFIEYWFGVVNLV